MNCRISMVGYSGMPHKKILSAFKQGYTSLKLICFKISTKNGSLRMNPLIIWPQNSDPDSNKSRKSISIWKFPLARRNWPMTELGQDGVGHMELARRSWRDGVEAIGMKKNSCQNERQWTKCFWKSTSTFMRVCPSAGFGTWNGIRIFSESNGIRQKNLFFF